ncbi:MAG: hypothetical protein LBH65_05510 [Desulfovibrio sp.]|jgi:hypothetical protein|nr:hypothetical protein [Desulfovibrio sp.]
MELLDQLEQRVNTLLDRVGTLRAENAVLRATREESLAGVKEEHDRVVTALKEAHQEEMKSLRQARDQELAALKEASQKETSAMGNETRTLRETLESERARNSDALSRIETLIGRIREQTDQE